jgi:hypothetical protein
MEKLLIVIALACLPGDRVIDLSSKLPRGVDGFRCVPRTVLHAVLHLPARFPR